VIAGRRATGVRFCAAGQHAIRDDRWKLIRYPQVNRTQLFDLQSDPQERNDLEKVNQPRRSRN
jgi:arylsulfatase A-like enzyme